MYGWQLLRYDTLGLTCGRLPSNIKLCSVDETPKTWSTCIRWPRRCAMSWRRRRPRRCASGGRLQEQQRKTAPCGLREPTRRSPPGPPQPSARPQVPFHYAAECGSPPAQTELQNAHCVFREVCPCSSVPLHAVTDFILERHVAQHADFRRAAPRHTSSVFARLCHTLADGVMVCRHGPADDHAALELVGVRRVHAHAGRAGVLLLRAHQVCGCDIAKHPPWTGYHLRWKLCPPMPGPLQGASCSPRLSTSHHLCELVPPADTPFSVNNVDYAIINLLSAFNLR